jgi:pectinesterase
MIVSKDGCGDFTTIQEAIDSIAKDNKERIEIYIKKGIYKEKVFIDVPFVALIGESIEDTIITYDDYALKKYPDGEFYNTFNSYTIYIGGDNFFAENITFQNSAGKGSEVGQAVAVYADGDKLHFKNCSFLAHQDTLFTGPLPPSPVERANFGGPGDGKERRKVKQYYESCYIEGDIDFIFGSATAVFKNCEIFSLNRFEGENYEEGAVSGYITAASTPEDVEFGYIFIDCNITGDAPKESVYLGRPWRIYAKTAFINCTMGECIKAEGWHNWDKPESETTTAYCEYNSKGPGGSSENRVSWIKLLSEEEVNKFIKESIFTALN